MSETCQQRTPRGKIKIVRAPMQEPEPVIARGQTWIEELVSHARRARVEQVIETNFHHLDIAIVGGERIARKERGRGRNEGANRLGHRKAG